MADSTDQEFENVRRMIQARLNLNKRRASLGDANGVVYVPGKQGYVYVREKQADGLGIRKEVRLHPLANVRIEPGLAVLLGYDDDNELCLMQGDFSGQLQQGANPWANNPLDPAFKFTNQADITTLLSHSTSPLSMSVVVRPWIYIIDNTAYSVPTTLVDLTSSVPAAGNHLLAGLFVKTDQTIETKLSTAQSELDPLDLTDVQECVTGATAGSSPCWFWRLYGGQTVVNDKRFVDGGDSFLDGRQIIAPIPGAVSILLPYLSGSTYKNVEDMNTVIHSTGQISGGAVTDNGDGTVAVATGSGALRKTNSDIVTLYFVTWATNSSVSLTNNSLNFIYIKYDSGTNNAAIEVTTSESTDYNTRFLLSRLYRNGTEIHLFNPALMKIGNHASLMVRSMNQGMGVMRASGGEISAVGTTQFSITAGVWWYGLTTFSTTAFDGTTGNFNYYYRDGGGGWTEVTGQTAIDNTRYDDGDGGLGTLSNNKYGVHWVYQAADNDIHVQYGQGDYTLAQAQAAQIPTAPPEVQADSFLIGKIIIKKSDTTFTSIEDAFAMFGAGGGGTAAGDHNSLTGLQGGAAAEYYHLTSAAYTTVASLANHVKLSDTAAGPGLEIQNAAGTAYATYRADIGTLIGAAGSNRTMRGKTGDPSSSSTRWDLNLGNFTAEGGSNAGSDLDLKNYDDSGTLIGTVLTVYRSSGQFNFAQNVIGGAVDPRTFDARLTLTSATPVLAANVTGATTLYLALYHGDRLALWNSTLSAWELVTLTEKTIKITDTQTGTLNGTTTVTGLTDTSQFVVGMQITGTNIPANTTIATIASATSITMNNAATGSGATALTFKCPASTVYDIFVYIVSAGTAKLEMVAWSNSGAGTGARATALALQNGVYIKTGDATRRYAGTIFTASTAGTVDFSLITGGGAASAYPRLGIFNYYNRVLYSAYHQETTDSWTYNSTSWRPLNGASSNVSNRVEIVVGVQDGNADGEVTAGVQPSAGTAYGGVGIGLNSTTANSAIANPEYYAPTGTLEMGAYASYGGMPGIGYNYLQALEVASGGTLTFTGDLGRAAGVVNSAIMVRWEC